MHVSLVGCKFGVVAVNGPPEGRSSKALELAKPEAQTPGCKLWGAEVSARNPSPLRIRAVIAFMLSSTSAPIYGSRNGLSIDAVES